MKNYFNIAEFLIEPSMREPESEVPLHVVEKILEHHLPILNEIRQELGAPLMISKRSGYRSVAWEKMKGRTGTSEHTFAALGAVDVTCDIKLLPKLMTLLQASDYSRVAYYETKGFFHCDFKDAAKGKRYYMVTKKGAWKLVEGVR